MGYKIVFTSQPIQQEIDTIHQGLEKHAKETIGKTSFEPFGYMVHANSGKLIAACTGVLMYGVVYIKLLWVDEHVRGHGLGSRLIAKAEAYAKEHNCSYITVDTFDWQAKSFYEKLNYTLEFSYDGYDNNAKFCYFRKKLTNKNGID